MPRWEQHLSLSYWDEDERLVVISSTQVPFHVRRIIAPLVGLPVKKIRVIKPRIGGGFGGKQDMLTEDLCALLTIKNWPASEAGIQPPSGIYSRTFPPCA